MKPILEICVDNMESVIIAAKNGADRLELCQELDVGGLTPSAGFVSMAKESVTIPIFMMIRPRKGNFVYTELEVKQMIKDIELGLQLNIDGFVTGALSSDGEVDVATCHKLMEAAKGKPVTFHRAFDLTEPNGMDFIDRALQEIICLGFTRILTSGRCATAHEGTSNIQALVQRASSSLIIMPGSGISPDNIQSILESTKCFEFHASAREKRITINDPNSKKDDAEDSIVQGTTFHSVTSSELVQKMKGILKNM